MGIGQVGLNRRRAEVFSPLDLPGDAGVVGGGDQVARPVADVARFNNEDDVLGNVRGMVADPFEVPRDQNQLDSGFDSALILMIDTTVRRSTATGWWRARSMKQRLSISIAAVT